MARIITPGNDQFTKGPHGDDWYKTTNITCPHCGCVFRLDEPDFQVLGPFVGLLLTQAYHWNKTDPSFNTVGAGTIYPDGISGNCPWCDYYPIQLLFADAGLIHPTSVGDPTTSSIQGYIAAGVRQVTFFLSNTLVLVALFLAADGTPYLADNVAHTSRAMIRTGATTFNYNVTFSQGTPGQPVNVSVARGLDAAMCAYLETLGFTLV